MEQIQKIDEHKRYGRQQLIAGWDQQKLTKSSVSIVGSDVLAQYTALALVSLGIGYVRIIDSAKASGEGFLDFELAGDSRARSLEEKLKIINPGIEIRGISSRLVAESSKYFLSDSNIIIDATNSPRSKAIAIECACETITPLISASCRNNYGKIMQYDSTDEKDPRFLLHTFDGAEQDEFVSIVMGGAIAEECKKVLMGQTGLLAVPLHYNLTNRNRFSFEPGKDIAPRAFGEFKGVKALICGAGALGSPLATGLTKLGFGRIDVIDPDSIEDTNRNRQFLYYDSEIGTEKAAALSEKIRKMGRGVVKSSHIVDYFTEKSEFKTKYDIIFDCVDNFTARAIISDYAAEHKLPLVSGASSFEASQVAIYSPGKSGCMDCQLDIHAEGKKAAERRKRIGCLEAPNPSVIMTNMVAGGQMVLEARTIFNPEKYGEPINGVLKYTANLESRWGVNFLKTVCACGPKGGLAIVRDEDLDAQDTGKQPVPLKDRIRNIFGGGKQ